MLKWENWLHGLIGGFIGGGASAGASWMGLALAHSAGLDVPTLNFKALGIVFVAAGISNAFTYLKQSPLPDIDDPTQNPPKP